MLRLHFFRTLAFSMTLVFGTSSAPVFADSTCSLQVEPSKPETAWHEKAHETEKTLRERNRAPHDCRSIRIEVQPEGNALLTFTTTDGRIAVRLLHTADDILATVEALLVTLPVDKPIENRVETSKSITSSPRTSSPGNIQASRVLPTSRPASRVAFDFFAGGRLGVDAGMFSSAIGVQALVLLQPWEIGIGGELNPLYGPLSGSAPAGFVLRSFQGIFLVGRRFEQGPRIFRLGGSFGFGLVHEEMDSDPVTKGRINIDAFQPRIGTYGVVVIPRDKKLRFIVVMHGDVAIWGMREAGTLKRNLPHLSRFGLGLALGMEIAP